MDANEAQLMVDGCSALLTILFGETNWYRWNEMKQMTQMANLQDFITWLLDVGDQALATSTSLPHELLKNESSGHHHHQQQESDIAIIADDIIPSSSSSSSHNMFMQEAGGELGQAGGTQVEITRLQDGSGNAFFCTSCNVTLNDVMVVDEHCHLRHTGLTLSLACYCCSTKYSSIPSYVQYHKQQRLITAHGGAKSYVCEYCAKGFKEKQLMEDHVNIKHLKLGPRHECQKCFKKFSYACDLSKHKKKCPYNLISLPQ